MLIQYNNCMKVKTFNISLPEGLIEQIDRQAKISYQTRSGYIRQVVFEALKEAGAISADAQILEDSEATYDSLRRNKLAAYLETIDVKQIAPDK